MAEGDSFLPRIQSVFYAVFDVRQGPKIVYQVPEGLISVPPTPTPDPSTSQLHLLPTSDHTSPRKRSVSANRALFNFDDISKSADLSCYEPVVRKISRVLTTCEEESAFLSNPETSTAIHPILEQLYEDLNSYSETSVQIDRFNSIQLKILPFYPNPPPVQDWQVPVALINLTKRIEPNWDLTMVKVCQLIDGITHVSKIAHLADCDLELTRQAVSHLLHYQVLMMVDIFQYSNMYTLRKSIQWLADEPHVIDECGPYVTKPGWPVPDWPKLLHLYSRLKPGKPIFEWMHEYGVHSLGIDVRRFTSFGVIKGFLRRVHRWPVLLPPTTAESELLEGQLSARKRRSSFSGRLSPAQQFNSDTNSFRLYSSRGRQSKTPDSLPASSVIAAVTVEHKTSAAEHALELLKSRHQKDLTNSTRSMKTDESHFTPVQSTIDKYGHPQPQHFVTMLSKKSQGPSDASVSLPHSQPPPIPPQPAQGGVVTSFTRRPTLSRSPSAPVAGQPKSSVGAAATSFASMGNPTMSSNLTYPPELAVLLDGEHHTDDLATRFEVGWPILEKWLVTVGGGTGEGDFGRVVIIYR